MAKKAPRDPGAPKRNMSAYLLYQNAMRETFKANNPGMTFGQLAKYTSAMYSELPPEEKDAWVARAEADKARYLSELATYVPPPGFDAKGDAVVTFARSGGSGRRSGKPERDPNAPKRCMSAYLLYQNAMRDQFRRENPGMTFGQLAKYTSAMYKCLTAEEKASWDARAAQDKQRYEEEMKNYVPPPGHDAQGILIEDHRVNRKAKKQKDPNAPKRARGSFVFFTFDMRPQILKEFPGIKFVEMGTIMGERWRALSPEDKKRYEDMASQDKIRFNQEMSRYMATKAAAQAAAGPPPGAMHHDMYTQQQGAPPPADPHAAYASDPNLAYNPHAAYDQTYQYHS